MIYKIQKMIIFIFISLFFSYDFAELPWKSVSVGISGNITNSATFIREDNVIYGLDILTFGLDYDEDDYYEDGGYEESNDFSITVITLMPKIGKKYDQRSKDRLNTYYIGEAYMLLPIVFVDMDDSEAEEELEELSEEYGDIFDNIGFRIAYGIEYKFNEQLSLCTDIGFNYLINNMELGDVDLRGTIGNTYTKLALQFSF